MKILQSKRFWIGMAIIGLLIAFNISGVFDFISLSYLQEKRVLLQGYVSSHYVLSAFLYILWYIMIVIFALPVAALTTIVGGFLFGVVPGTIYTNIGATIGATIFFLIVRHVIGQQLQEVYADKLMWLNDQMDRYGTSYLIAIHTVAIVPFFVLNALIGLTRVSLWKFIWTTSVGIIPGSLVYAFAGQELAHIASLQDILSFPVVMAFLLLGLLALIPIAVQRYYQ